MGAAIRLRGDFDAADWRRLAKRSRDGAQSRRFLVHAMIYDGRRRSDAARFAGAGLQIVRDWVPRFNAEGPAGSVSRVADFIKAADRAVERTVPGARPCPFGHVGDGNIHYNVSQPPGADTQACLARREELTTAVHDIAQAARRLGFGRARRRTAQGGGDHPLQARPRDRDDAGG